MKNLIFAAAVLLSIHSNAYAACPQAVPSSDANFCASFKSVSECHCLGAGLPSFMCRDTDAIYKRMLVVFGSVQKACEYQKDTDVQTCIDDWNCYRNGGSNSNGESCSGTAHACQS